MGFGFSEKTIVEEDSGDEADGAEHAEKPPDHGLGDHVICQRPKDHVGNPARKFKNRPEHPHDQKDRKAQAHGGAEDLLQAGTEPGGECQPYNGPHDQRSGQNQVGDSAAPAAPVTVGKIADHRACHQPDRQRQRAEQQPHHHVRDIVFLEQELHHRKNRPIPHLPGKIPPEQPSK